MSVAAELATPTERDLGHLHALDAMRAVAALLGTTAIAAVSYLLVERPAMRLARRLTARPRSRPRGAHPGNG